MFEDFADDVLKAEVTARGSHLKGAGTALIISIREDKNRSGKIAIMDLLVLTSKPQKEGGECNFTGEKVSKLYQFQDGSADKRAAIVANFKKDMCTLSDLDHKRLTSDQFKAIGKAAGENKFTGMLIRYDPYDTENKAGEARTYHNLSKVAGKNTPADITKRAEQLAKGAGAETFL